MEDLLEVMRSAALGIQALEMNLEDFVKWDNLCKTRTRNNDVPLFKNIVEAKFISGERKLLYKTSFADEDYKQCVILKAKAKLVVPRCIEKPREILTSKKAKIVKDLLPKMPSSRREFWLALPDCDSSPDLLNGDPSTTADE
jgi:hypothetical protein